MIKKVQATVMDIMFLHKFLSEEIEENQNSEPIYPAIVEMLMIKNYKLILPVVKEIDNEKNKLLEKYGVQQPDGTYALDLNDIEKSQAYAKENSKIMSGTRTVKIRPIKLSYFENTPGIGFSSMRKLDFLVI